jgi:hypothetical protein
VSLGVGAVTHGQTLGSSGTCAPTDTADHVAAPPRRAAITAAVRNLVFIAAVRPS